ncbi:hypothetical protein K0B96_06135 [Horticoccus luteus]|uniref:YD repeat-containing protein n=1 Tax=Horticoccus luteus TaxID=2862869 RepID=A0A8F9TW45_9BACT|nr:hypothetical protein [Horticoccus luteus]QYM80191.1 hypothetical protein K0B96_06135 [Horticoccus luteus]
MKTSVSRYGLFDGPGQLTTTTQFPTGGPSIWFNYDYDLDGQRTASGTAAGTWVGRAYNSRHEVKEVQQRGGVPILWVGDTRNLAGEPTTITNYAGVRDDLAYDGAGRRTYRQTIRNSGSVNLLLRRYGYNLRDAQVWTTRDDGYGDTYEYFPDLQLNRYRYSVWRPDLNFWNPAGWTDTFAYDQAGNRTALNENGAVTSYSANALNQYTSITGLAVNHADGRGNLTQLGGWTYVYDADNRLKQASTTGNTMEFFYDPEGRLTRVNRNGIPEYRYYDWGQCFLRTQADGTWIDFMIWGPTPDELTSRWDAAHGGWMFFHHTPVNSPDLATDIGGNVVERYLYDPFGAPDIRDLR